MSDERPGGPIRIGDKEREDAVRRLGEHYEAGRLTAEEHTERIGRALEAKTEADLAALFSDLPGGHRTGAASGSGPASGEAWDGPWGWTKPPWTAPEGSAQGGGPGRPAWAARGPLGKIPFPLLIGLAAIALIASIGCVVGGGHPPILPLLLVVAAVVIVRRRRQERRA
ncbi:DUF1707 domain-containing protein [Kribbella turkmenica]|uniref:DUF1707 domain-containing protein n=1 Tax=Kribbella turkmenica TaxID=2530375 RepID=A0A4R4WL77_9ACTN|nr:DUF1707 domain-containing protein [Kribbella turkmenica]TDD17203.1 DUF1707 domain-containing protein [Kribbella turkmenica]